jgi:hypothetical protein
MNSRELSSLAEAKDKVHVEVNEIFDNIGPKRAIYKTSESFQDEIKSFSELRNNQTEFDLYEDKLTAPTDNFFISKKLKSTPLETEKHEFLFVLNFFATYLNEDIDSIEKVKLK